MMRQYAARTTRRPVSPIVALTGPDPLGGTIFSRTSVLQFSRFGSERVASIAMPVDMEAMLKAKTG
jgi:hypothetical protein